MIVVALAVKTYENVGLGISRQEHAELMREEEYELEETCVRHWGSKSLGNRKSRSSTFGAVVIVGGLSLARAELIAV